MYLQYFSSLERAEDVLKKVSGVRARPASVYAQGAAKAGRDARRVTSTGLCFGRSEGLLLNLAMSIRILPKKQES